MFGNVCVSHMMAAGFSDTEPLHGFPCVLTKPVLQGKRLRKQKITLPIFGSSEPWDPANPLPLHPSI